MTMSPVQPAPAAPPAPSGGSLARRLVRLPNRLAAALTSPYDVDGYLGLLGPNLLQRDVRAQVLSVRHQTPGSVTLTLRANRAWTGHVAGQHVQVGVEINGVVCNRYYSPVNSQHTSDRLLELTVRTHDDGLVSPVLASGVTPGTMLRLSAPMGDFTLPAERPHRLLLISGGSGITPVLSMLRTLHDERFTGDVVFLHYARTPQDVPYAAELARLAGEMHSARVEIVYTRQPAGELPAGQPQPLSGHFSREHLTQVAPWFAEAPAFVCGPPSLIADVGELYAHDALDDLVHVERFTIDGTTIPDGETVTGQITFSASGVTVPNSGRSLLLQAEAAGLSPEYGCRMGSCHGCVQVKHSGVVRNQLTGKLHHEPDEDIQTCISVPLGDVDLKI